LRTPNNEEEAIAILKRNHSDIVLDRNVVELVRVVKSDYLKYIAAIVLTTSNPTVLIYYNVTMLGWIYSETFK
jgi:hypothetical protein